MFQKDVRNYRLQVRLSDKEKETIDTYCSKQHCKASDMVRTVVLDYIYNHPIENEEPQQDTNESSK